MASLLRPIQGASVLRPVGRRRSPSGAVSSMAAPDVPQATPTVGDTVATPPVTVSVEDPMAKVKPGPEPLAVMVEVPAATPVANPPGVIVATEGVADSQVTEPVM